MIVPKVPIVVHKRASHDIYGQEQVALGKVERCCVVKLERKSQHTTVRVDSGATRAAADEEVADAVLLLVRSTLAELDDIIKVPSEGVSLRVRTKRARYTVTGKLDHYEVRCAIE